MQDQVKGMSYKIPKAQSLYRQAGELGSGSAWYWLAQMVLYGEGCNGDEQKALELYEKAVKTGYHVAYIEMAEIFLERKHYDNFQKCWGFFFQSPRFLRFTDKAHYVANYLQTLQLRQLPNRHFAMLNALKDQILQSAVDQAEENKFTVFADSMGDVYRKHIRVIKVSVL